MDGQGVSATCQSRRRPIRGRRGQVEGGPPHAAFGYLGRNVEEFLLTGPPLAYNDIALLRSALLSYPRSWIILVTSVQFSRLSQLLSAAAPRGPHFAVHLSAHTQHSQKAGPFSVARLKMDLPFHNRLAYNRVHRRRAGTLAAPTHTRPQCHDVLSPHAMLERCRPACLPRCVGEAVHRLRRNHAITLVVVRAVPQVSRRPRWPGRISPP